MTGLDTCGRHAGTSIGPGRATLRAGGRSPSPAHRDAAVGDRDARRGHDRMAGDPDRRAGGGLGGLCPRRTRSLDGRCPCRWFAVTALFRRPLGLPIPHTAIVVARKEQFGQTLATFFRENFLSGDCGRRAHAELRLGGAGVDMARRARARDDDGPQRARPQCRCPRHPSSSVSSTWSSPRYAAPPPACPSRRCPRASCVPRSRARSSTTASRRCAPRLGVSSPNAATGSRRCSTRNVPGGFRKPCSTGSSSTWSTGPSTPSTRSHAIPSIRPGNSCAPRVESRRPPRARSRVRRPPARSAAHSWPRIRVSTPCSLSMVTGVVDRLQIEARNPGSQLEERLVDLITENAVRSP